MAERYALGGANARLKYLIENYQNVAMNSLSGPPLQSLYYPPHNLSQNENTLRALGLSRELTIDELNKMIIKQSSPGSGHFDPYRGLLSDESALYTAIPSGRMIRTHLESQEITGFLIGGEMWLCVPQILHRILNDVTHEKIQKVHDELGIFCRKCEDKQMAILMQEKVIPEGTTSACGLITKTDAERLISALLHDCPSRRYEPYTINSFNVYHECFGKCKGVFQPELYTDANASCIGCIGCQGLFSPQRFVCHVCHTHKSERRTCHWGFDSANWRTYLLLDKGQRVDLQKVLQDMKDRFDPKYFKRKMATCFPPGTPPEVKRFQSSSPTVGVVRSSSHNGEAAANGNLSGVVTKSEVVERETISPGSSTTSSSSAFRPWSANAEMSSASSRQTSLPSGYLQREPPALLNPDKVITNQDRSMHNIAPNVSLVPLPPKKRREDVHYSKCQDGELNLESPVKKSTPNYSIQKIETVSSRSQISYDVDVDACPSDHEDTRSSTSVTSSLSGSSDVQEPCAIDLMREALWGAAKMNGEKEKIMCLFVKLNNAREALIDELQCNNLAQRKKIKELSARLS